MKQKIKDLFRKAYSKLFRKRTRGTHTEAPYIFGLEFNGCGEGTLQLNPEWLRKQFEEAYPDAAKFLNSIKALPELSQAIGSISEAGRHLKTTIAKLNVK